MTKQEMLEVEDKMILGLLIELAKQREGANKITPCGKCEVVADGLTIEDMGEGRKVYMLWYNVGPDTHAARIETNSKAE